MRSLLTHRPRRVEAPVVLAATNEAALTIVPREALEACAADVPDDISALE